MSANKSINHPIGDSTNQPKVTMSKTEYYPTNEKFVSVNNLEEIIDKFKSVQTDTDGKLTTLNSKFNSFIEKEDKDIKALHDTYLHDLNEVEDKFDKHVDEVNEKIGKLTNLTNEHTEEIDRFNEGNVY